MTMEILYVIIVGAIIGWIAGKIMKGGGFGFIVNMIVGIIGSMIGSFTFKQLGVQAEGGLLIDVIVGVIGAIILLFIVGLFKKK